MLELRPNCEMCDCDLPANSTQARICSYECTFCADCVDTVLRDVCPNCGGGFVPRPVRPATAHRHGTGLRHHPAGTKRRNLKWTTADITAFVAKRRHLPPTER
ncbi:DUF1272 domain-containing protein [uncultured Sulfitobacter sp.]|uniref:DUF1272 domain-containing protein n=1 Tax=uncultured Sulfitobacter sp. TaxID=191468 RepID=UPI002629C8F7|nr:DUF1272 domain-containing protein [uncultured Sulfitobacter sp.]